MPTSQKRTTKTSTLEINFDHVDRRNCYIEAQKLGSKAYMNTRFAATSRERYFGRRDTLAKYNVPRRYRPSFWKGWKAGWQIAWWTDHMEQNVAFEKEIQAYLASEGANPDKAITKLYMEDAGVLNT